MNSLLVEKTLHRITLTQKSEGLTWLLIFPYECYEDWLAKKVKLGTNHISLTYGFSVLVLCIS